MTEEARRALVEACGSEPITLFVGAGISHSRGVPLWNDVVERMAEWVTGADGDSALLERARSLVRRELGHDVADRVVLRTHPLEPQLALEWILARLEDEDVRRQVAQRLGTPEVSFVSLLRRALYENVGRRSESDALSAVGDAVRAEYGRWPRRRLVRIVTLNADDLLEREAAGDGVRRVHPIARPSGHPPSGNGAQPPPIPLYHVHGYLPEDTSDPAAAPDTLVFTDDRFWSTTAHPLSFANRVVANALHDTQCVFAGLSMRDVNLMRWLAVRYDEVMRDVREGEGDAEANDALRRHFWIHTAGDDPTGILTGVLGRRGVRSVQIASWTGGHFGELLRTCFRR